MMIKSAVSALAIFATLLGPVSGLAGEADSGRLPQLDVTLAPYGDRNVAGIRASMRVESPDVPAGEPLLRMPLRLVSMPTAAYTAEEICAVDSEGSLKLMAVEEEPNSSGSYRHFVADRDTVGDLRIEYGTEPRQVDEDTRNGPLFDIRPQNGGFMGSGVYFMLLPADEEQTYRITLDWDLSDAPDGTRTVWSLGEGSQTIERKASTLQFTYYAVGDVKRANPDPDASFNMYWISEPPFQIDRLADNIMALFTEMATFFEQPDEEYRVFIRENPHRGGGGTGFFQSFAFSYGTDDDSPEDGPIMLLAHEIAHNWTRLNAGQEHWETAWYTEGTAEFNKVVMAFRTGLLDRDEMLAEVNEMARKYYSNPYLDATNEAAGKLFWSDSRAQRVPYGRGFMYLVGVDARLREASDGSESLLDFILEINRRQDEGEEIGTERWQDLLAERIGEEARDRFAAMAAGETIVPPDNALAPCFEVYEDEILPFELGFDRMNLGRVTSLEVGSRAERAGLEEGDRIESITPLDDLYGDQRARMEIVVERDGETLTLDYLPRGEPRAAWLWRKTDAPDSACDF